MSFVCSIQSCATLSVSSDFTRFRSCKIVAMLCPFCSALFDKLSKGLIVQHFPYLFLHVHGTHVHHFTYGVFVLSIIGFIAITTDQGRRLQAFVYGIGIALAFDEFGMWVRLTDRYNIEASEDAIAWIFAFLVFLVYGIGIIRRAWPLMRKTIRRP